MGSATWYSRINSAFGTGIPYEYRFKFLLLHFQSSSLLMAWEGSGGQLKSFSPSTPMEVMEEAPGFGPSQLWPLWSSGE